MGLPGLDGSTKTDMQGKRVLLLWAAPEAVKAYRKAGAEVCCVVEHWEAAKATHHLYGRDNPVVYMPVMGYLQGAQCQQFDHVVVFDTSGDQVRDAACMRVTKFGGSVLYSETAEVRSKLPGFLLSSYPRCGTHMLVTALDQHPQLTCYGEVFNRDSQNGAHQFLTEQQVLEAFWPNRKTGFAAHAYLGRHRGGAPGMVSRGRCQHFWDVLPKELKIVSLRRHDLLARHVSHLEARATGQWNVYREERKKPVQPPVTVKLKRVFRDIEFVKRCWDAVDVAYPNRLVVWYEDLVNHWMRELARILAYLGASWEFSLPASRLLGSRPLGARVANYQELMEKVQSYGGAKAYKI